MNHKGIAIATGLLALCAWGWSAAVRAQEPPLSLALHEEVRMIPSIQPGAPLETTLYKPNGNGPFPVVIMNHGKNRGNPALQKRARYLVIAREFIERGYAVVMPMRRGFSASGGQYFSGGCDIRTNIVAQADDIQATLDYVLKQTWADRERIVVMGQSHGGLSTMAFAARKPAQVKAVVNFAGGLRKDTQCPWRKELVELFDEYGKTATIPSVWFYGANDSYFDPALARAMASAYASHGADTELVAYGAFKQDSHGMSSSPDGLPIWWPKTEALLQRVGLPTKRLFIATDNGELPITRLARNDDTTAVPYLKPSGQVSFAKLLQAPVPRAFAISPSGAWGWATGGTNAIERAINNCQTRSSTPCQLYLVNQAMVWRGDAAK